MKSTLLTLLLLTGCAQSAAERQADVVRVLFIGNSLTAANGLPVMVQAVVASSGDRLECAALAVSGFSLEDHWARGDARREIARGGWAFVVLQQGPSALPESRVGLREYVRRFDGEVRRAGARTALYMVWPSRARSGDFDAVSTSYAMAAKDVGGVLLSAGDLWRAAWQQDATLPFYGADGFHPSPLGSYVAALAISRGLTGRPPRVTESLQSPTGAFPSITLSPGAAKLLAEISVQERAGQDR